MQIPILKDILRAMNIPFFEKEGFEADDIIGSLSSYSDEKGIKSIIVSGDKDQLQLVSDNTRVLFTKRGVSHFDMYDKESMARAIGAVSVPPRTSPSGPRPVGEEAQDVQCDGL